MRAAVSLARGAKAALRRVRPPWFRRRFFGIALGAGKTGSHSLAALFGRYRADHEAMPKRSVDAVVRRARGEDSDEATARFLRWRDRFLCLEMEASPFLRHFADLLPRLFPQARFVLLVREPRSWLDSRFNHRLARPAAQYWLRLAEVNWPAGSVWPEEERCLQEMGLPSLDSLLGDWVRSVERVERAIPPDRLLTVRTHEIGGRLEEIAAHFGIPPSSLVRERAHSYPAARRYGVLARLPAAHVEERVREVAGPVASRLFPEEWA